MNTLVFESSMNTQNAPTDFETAGGLLGVLRGTEVGEPGAGPVPVEGI